jgi:hypothetical protein
MTVATPTRTSELIETIATLAEQMQHDVEGQGSKESLFLSLREMRRSVHALDQELREGSVNTIGDAC